MNDDSAARDISIALRRRRKPIGVWILLDSGPWNFENCPNLDDAMRTARTLRTGPPLFPGYRVWIASPAIQGKKTTR